MLSRGLTEDVRASASSQLYQSEVIEIRANSTNWKRDVFVKGALKSLGSDSESDSESDLFRSHLWVGLLRIEIRPINAT